MDCLTSFSHLQQRMRFPFHDLATISLHLTSPLLRKQPFLSFMAAILNFFMHRKDAQCKSRESQYQHYPPRVNKCPLGASWAVLCCCQKWALITQKLCINLQVKLKVNSKAERMQPKLVKNVHFTFLPWGWGLSGECSQAFNPPQVYCTFLFSDVFLTKLAGQGWWNFDVCQLSI